MEVTRAMKNHEKHADASGVETTEMQKDGGRKRSAMWWIGQAMSIYLGI